jgi:DNA-binding GntR family transcriptional regulator
MQNTSEAHSASDRVYSHAKAQILARRYAPHDLITEGELAEAVGVSRTPAREALLRLQADGLVRLLPKRGALVQPVTADEIADVLETRRLVETFAIRKAVSSPGSGLLSRLGEHLRAMREAMAVRDAARYVEADRDFHAELVASTGNAILIDLYRSLRDRQLRMGTINLLAADGCDVDPGRMKTTLAEHQAILDAVAARTVRAAEAAVGAHLDRAAALLSRPR